MNGKIKMKKREYLPDESGIPGKKLPFVVPDSYFDNFPGRVQERLTGREKPVLRSAFSAYRTKFAVAAVFVGLLALGYAGFRILDDRWNASSSNSEEWLETLEYLGYDLDDELLISALDDAEITLPSQSLDDRTTEIIEILSEEDLNLNDLLNEY